MWNTYPDFSLSFRETQHSSLIAIKYIASLGYILLTIFSRINHLFKLKWRIQICNPIKYARDGLVMEQHHLRFSLCDCFAECTGVKLTLSIPCILLETDCVL